MTNYYDEVRREFDNWLKNYEGGNTFPEIADFFIEKMKEREEEIRGWERYRILRGLTERVKIAQIIKPKDRSGLLVWLDDETLTENDVINLIDGTKLDSLLDTKLSDKEI